MTDMRSSSAVRLVAISAVLLTLTLAISVSGCRDAGEGDVAQTHSDDHDVPAGNEDSGSVIQATDATFDEIVLGSQTPVLVDFYADWCPPCRSMRPNIETVAREYVGRCKVVQANVDKCGKTASTYGISGIPAVYLFVGGRPVDTAVGYREVSQLRTMINKQLN